MQDSVNLTPIWKLDLKANYLIIRFILLLLATGIIISGCAGIPIAGRPSIEFREDFTEGRLDHRKWVIVKEGRSNVSFFHCRHYGSWIAWRR